MSSTTVLALNANGDGMDRMKVNATNGLIVDNSGVTQPVSGTFFQATQPVSLAGSVTVDGSGVTQPVSIAATVTVDGSGATQPVSGTFFQATQPVSLAGTVTVDGSASTQPVSGTFFQATQPVSIAGNVNTVGGALSVANNSLWSSQTIANMATAVTTGLDISLYRSLIIYGDTDKPSGEIVIQISFDNSTYYDLGTNLYPDGLSGNFVSQIESDAKYIRLSRTNSAGSLETITAGIMIKSG
jgi:hypothetical protein